MPVPLQPVPENENIHDKEDGTVMGIWFLRAKTKRKVLN
jgi:hypothetical protein